MQFVINPNLPESKVKAVLVSESAEKGVVESLTKNGIEPLVVPPCANVAPPVSAHPDMLFHHLGGNKIIYYRGVDGKLCGKLKKLGFELTECVSSLKPDYPHDIALNSARVGNYIFCNLRYTDKSIIDYCKKNSIEIIPIKQGYAKCSVLAADSNSIITSDKSIAAAVKKYGFDVLLIRAGFIGLSGYDTGFIGGCCGKLDKDKMYFCGDVTKHPDYCEIKKFLEERGISIYILGSGPLSDVGSIIPLLQE